MTVSLHNCGGELLGTVVLDGNTMALKFMHLNIDIVPKWTYKNTMVLRW